MKKHLTERHPELDMTDPSNKIAEKFFRMKINKRYTTAMDHQLGGQGGWTPKR